MLRPELHLVDGENLVMRYQAMLAEGRQPIAGVIHEQDILVWSPRIINNQVGDIRRVTYYTSAIGDDDRLIALARKIRQIPYTCTIGTASKTGHLFAEVFKKPRNTTKSRAVDINIVMDALRHASNGSAGHVSLYSGDSDFIPLIKELMKLGVEVHVKAFSSGLSPQMEVAADEFYLLDNVFFERVS